MENLDKEKNCKVLEIKKIDNQNTKITISWQPGIPYIPWVGALLDRFNLVREEEDSKYIN